MTGDLTPDTTFTTLNPDQITSITALQTWKDNSTLRDPPWATFYPEHPTYGVVGDNSTVNTAAFATVMTAAAAETYGAVVSLGPGTFITDKFTISDNVTLVGAGRGLTIIKLINAASSSSSILENATRTAGGGGNTNITVRGITFDGNKAGQTGSTIHCVDIKEGSDIRFEDCEFKNANNIGLVFQNTVRCNATRCMAKDNGTFGFYCQTNYTDVGPTQCSDITYTDCRALTNGQQGFDVFDTHGVQYTSCLCDGNDVTNAVATSGQFGLDDCQDVTYLGCESRNGTQGGFSVFFGVLSNNGPEDIKYIGCISESNTVRGFYISNAKNFALVGCTVRSNGSSGVEIATTAADTAGVSGSEDGTTEHFAINGGIYELNANNGIHLQGARDGVICGAAVLNNSTSSSGTYQGIRVQDQSAGSAYISEEIIITGNRIGDTQDSATQGNAILVGAAARDSFIHGNTIRRGSTATRINISTTGLGIRCQNNDGVQAVSQASAGTFDPSPVNDFITVTGTTNIDTAIGTTHAYVGREITLLFAGILTVSNGITTKLAGAANFTTAADDMLTLVYDGTDWVEKSRSVN